MITDLLLEKGILPDPVIRMAVRSRLRHLLNRERRGSKEDLKRKRTLLIEELSQSPVAINTREANVQHYELPASFFKSILGPRLKYSCGLWDYSSWDLGQSEEAMLKLTLERSDIRAEQEVLDLGCGWGAFTLFAARLFPSSHFTAVSNSSSQKDFIEEEARKAGLWNVSALVSDINEFKPGKRFHRIVSVEMFEHVRNYRTLFERIHGWLHAEGKLFVHLFAHRELAYTFDAEEESNWMARHFFTGGMMPADDLLFSFSKQFNTLGHWRINGMHYARTLESWLSRMDSGQSQVREIFTGIYRDEAMRQWRLWRIFFMACAETFAFDKGREWGVSHYLFQKK